MAGGIGDDFKELVRSSTNLVDLVSEIVALRPQNRGSDYVGLCPFHEDRNPSFHVYPERQTYRCWVCDTGGDCFRWVMETEKVEFREALETLARRANIPLPTKRQQGAAQSEQSRQDRYTVMEWAASVMQHALRSAPADGLVRAYVKGRRLSDDTVRNFRIGYHPENWNWFQEKSSGKFSAQQLLAAGLIREHRSGHGHFDNQLTGRLIFPIVDERGRPVAFGGRLIPGSSIESDAKYWNSPESTIFHKRRMLYAFDRARESIRRSRTAVVVEGYMDCIACHQAGVDNVVATLGTALTEEHVRFLRRFVDQVVLLYDGDTAGQQSAERSISQFLAQDLDLRILTLPDGKDPADFLERHPADEIRRLISTAPEAWEYKLQRLISRSSLETINGRQQVLSQMLEFLRDSPGMTGTVREDLILKKTCSRIQVEERLARQQLSQMRSVQESGRSLRRVRREPVRDELPSTGTNGLRASVERELLEIVLVCPEVIDVVGQHIGAEDFEDPGFQRLLALSLDLWKEDGELPELDRVVSACDSDAGLLSLINAILDEAEKKNVVDLMKDLLPPTDGQQQAMPIHLERVLCPLVERREQRLLARQRMAQGESAAASLDGEARDVLNRLYAFRKTQMGHPSAMK